MSDPNQDQHDRSGKVVDCSRLVAFLYDLIRDHVKPGVLEQVARDVESRDVRYLFTNGWLALFAQDLASRLQGTIPVAGKDDADAARASILAAHPGLRAETVLAAENHLFECLRQSVIAWIDDPKPDIRCVLAVLARIKAFRAMLRGLPAPRRGRKDPDADQGMARRRRGARRRGGRS